ncbi:MAG: cupin domain-containing protein [Bacteroidota bacterium]
MNHVKVIPLRERANTHAQGFRRQTIFNETQTQGQISLEYVILSTGAESSPHIHVGTHTVVYTLQGKVKVYYGEKLQHHVKVGPRDSVYIPPDVLHYVVNEDEQDMVAVVARTPGKHLVKEVEQAITFLPTHNLYIK